eukprot:163104-Chlamydomonas_euryale.AAC.1
MPNPTHPPHPPSLLNPGECGRGAPAGAAGDGVRKPGGVRCAAARRGGRAHAPRRGYGGAQAEGRGAAAR